MILWHPSLLDFVTENKTRLKTQEEKAWSTKLSKEPTVFTANTLIREFGKQLMVKYLLHAKVNQGILRTGMPGQQRKDRSVIRHLHRQVLPVCSLLLWREGMIRCTVTVNSHRCLFFRCEIHFMFSISWLQQTTKIFLQQIFLRQTFPAIQYTHVDHSSCFVAQQYRAKVRIRQY